MFWGLPANLRCFEVHSLFAKETLEIVYLNKHFHKTQHAIFLPSLKFSLSIHNLMHIPEQASMSSAPAICAQRTEGVA